MRFHDNPDTDKCIRECGFLFMQYLLELFELIKKTIAIISQFTVCDIYKDNSNMPLFRGHKSITRKQIQVTKP